MESFKPFIAKIATGARLSADEARQSFDAMLSGEVTPAQMGGFLMALRVRGESVEEITGAVTAMRAKMLRVEAPAGAIDIVGTGGDGHGSYNVSTVSALIVAGCGVSCRQARQSRGVFALGRERRADRARRQDRHSRRRGRRLHREAGVGFMMAQTHHAAMRHVGAARVELGTRTIFNLLGPLSNPAGVKRQLLGVFSREWLKPMAETLKALGSERVWLVHGSDGLDEITTTGPTHVVELNDGAIKSFDIAPEDIGVSRATLADLKGGDPSHNAAALTAVLDGARGPYRDIAIFNSAAALVVAGKARDLKEGAAAAAKSIDEGAARAALAKLVATSNAGGA